jgi:hypothetical protein
LRGIIFFLFGVGVLGIVSGSGCATQDLEPPVPPSQIVPPPTIGPGLDEHAVPATWGRRDAWFDAFQGYMPVEMQRDYLGTPEDDRFERFGLRLLDFQLREDLLREHHDELTRDEQDFYRRLPSAEACRRYVAERSGVARITSNGSGKK